MAKPCIDCSSEIPDDARKCVHCGALQTWLRHIGFSSTVLSLLVALVSVAGLAIPPIVDAFTPLESRLSSQVLSVGAIRADYDARMASGNSSWGYVGLRYCVTFTVLVHNSGNAPGVLKTAQIFMHGADEKIAAQAEYIVPASDAIIKPKDFRAVEITTPLVIRNKTIFPQAKAVPVDETTFQAPYSKGKVMLRTVGHDGNEEAVPHLLFGSYGSARLEKGSCGPS
jgi:hypothetical protein